MATVTELLKDLHSLEKEAYKSVIEVAKKTGKKKAGNFIVLNNYIESRKDRLEALHDAVLNAEKSDAIQEDYEQFKQIVDKVSGNDADLDIQNGWISQTVYGDLKKQRMRKRDVAAINIIQSSLVLEVVDRLNTFKDSLDELKNKIPD